MIPRTVIAPQTIGRRVRNMVLLAGAAVAAYGGIHAIPQALDTHARKSHAAEVRELLSSGHPEQATELFASYRTAEQLRSADIIALQALLTEHQRTAAIAQSLAPFDAAVGKYDYAAASAELDHLRSTLPAPQLSDLEQRLTAISDEGMFQRILIAKPDERNALLRAYLIHYSQGTHRRDVAVYAIAEQVDTLVGAIDQRKPIALLIPPMHTLTELCTTHGKEAAPLPPEIPLQSIASKVQGYLTNGKETPTGDFKVGDCVSIKEITFPFIPYKNVYLAERNKNFPPGSIGYVVGFNTLDNKQVDIYVEFLNAQPEWDRPWDYVPLELRRPAVAVYSNSIPVTNSHNKDTELIRRPRFTSAEQSVLQFELDRLLAAAKPFLLVQSPENNATEPLLPVTGSEPRIRGSPYAN